MDEYLCRDDQGILIRDGRRQGEDRRRDFNRRTHLSFEKDGRFSRRKMWGRREPGERRIGMVYSLIDMFYEHLSSFILGIFLIMMGICMLITGLTFLPVVGLYAGIVVISVGAGFLIRAFRSNWPTV